MSDIDFPALHQMPVADLRKLARELQIPEADQMRGWDLAFAVGCQQAERRGSTARYGRGVLEVKGDYGFLRAATNSFLPGRDHDIYMSQTQIRRLKLQTGDTVIGTIREPKDNEQHLAMLQVLCITGDSPDHPPPDFDRLPTVHPEERLRPSDNGVLRAVDYVSPVGLGQRGLLVAPSRCGHEALLRSIAALFTRDEDLHVTVLLSGERPEEIDTWRRHDQVEVVSTPGDEAAARHVQVAEIAFERGRRMAERGYDAVLLVDSLSRLLRFCLADLTPSDKTVEGIDSASLQRVRRWFGSARAFEEGGSLTILGVIGGEPGHGLEAGLLNDLVDMANWELRLSRELAERGLEPPIEVGSSSTRYAEKLLDDKEVMARRKWRASLSGDPLKDLQALLKIARKGDSA